MKLQLAAESGRDPGMVWQLRIEYAVAIYHPPPALKLRSDKCHEQGWSAGGCFAGGRGLDAVSGQNEAGIPRRPGTSKGGNNLICPVISVRKMHMAH